MPFHIPLFFDQPGQTGVGGGLAALQISGLQMVNAESSTGLVIIQKDVKHTVRTGILPNLSRFLPTNHFGVTQQARDLGWSQTKNIGACEQRWRCWRNGDWFVVLRQCGRFAGNLFCGFRLDHDRPGRHRFR